METPKKRTESKKPVTDLRESLDKSKELSKGVSTRMPFSEENRFDRKFSNGTEDFESELYKPKEENTFTRPAIVPPLDLRPIIRKREAHIYTTSYSDTDSPSMKLKKNLGKIKEVENSNENSEEEKDTFTSHVSEHDQAVIRIKEEEADLNDEEEGSGEGMPKIKIKSSRKSKKSNKKSVAVVKEKIENQDDGLNMNKGKKKKNSKKRKIFIFFIFVCSLIYLWDLVTGFLLEFMIEGVSEKAKNWSSGTLKFIFMSFLNLINFMFFLPLIKHLSVLGYLVFEKNFMTNWICLLTTYIVSTFLLYKIATTCSKSCLNKFLYNNVYFSKQKKFKKISKSRIFSIFLLILPWSAKVVILGGMGFKLDIEDFIKLSLFWVSVKTLFFAFVGEAFDDPEKATSFTKFNFGSLFGIFCFIISTLSYIFSIYFFYMNSKYGIIKGKSQKRATIHPLDESVVKGLNKEIEPGDVKLSEEIGIQGGGGKFEIQGSDDDEEEKEEV